MSHVPACVSLLALALGATSNILAADKRHEKRASNQLGDLLETAVPVPNQWPEVADPLKSDLRQPDRTTFVVPAGLRDLLKGEDILAGELSCSFLIDKGHGEWQWILSGLEFKGARDRMEASKLQQRLLERAKRAEFRRKDLEYIADLPAIWRKNPGTTVLQRASSEREEIVSWTPMVDLVHSHNGAMDFCWQVRSIVPVAAPTYAQIIEALPCMQARCDGEYPFPNSLLYLLRRQKVVEASISGNGTTWYCLSLCVAVDPNKENEADALQAAIIERLRIEGFERQDHSPVKWRRGRMDFRKGADARDSSCNVSVFRSKKGLEVSLGLNFEPDEAAR